MRSCTDVADLRRHTEYQNGYFDQHPTVRALWQIVQDFNSEEKRAFLKFVTSCPKVKKKKPKAMRLPPPLLTPFITATTGRF